MLLEACAGERVPGSCWQVSVFDASPVSFAGRREGALRVKDGMRREVPFRIFCQTEAIYCLELPCF